jgi:thiol-disulfide isomerase/thioredoxin
MANRFNVRLPVVEDPAVLAIEAKHVKEVAENDWEKEVVGAALPVVVHFHGTESSASEALGPRFGAVAEKFSGKIQFVKINRQSNANLAAKLGVTASPTIVFLQDGKEKGERLSGEDIKRTTLKARVEAMLGVAAAIPPK